MHKYSLTFKMKIVKDYINSEGGYNYLGKKYGIDTATIRNWIKRYQLHGLKGLQGGGKSYSSKFKVYVIDYIQEHELSNKEAAIHFKIGSHTTIKKWQDLYKNGDKKALNGKRKGRPPIMAKSNSGKKIEPLE